MFGPNGSIINNLSSFFGAMQNSNSALWKKYLQGGSLEIVLHACSSAGDSPNSLYSIAAQISALPNVTVTAPDATNLASSNGTEYGPYHNILEINGIVVAYSDQGYWIVFKDGKIIKAYKNNDPNGNNGSLFSFSPPSNDVSSNSQSQQDQEWQEYIKQQNEARSTFQQGRPHEGDSGYQGSFWQTYDDTKKF